MFDIPQFVKEIIKTIEKAGFEAYLVGGCVRDLMLGQKPNDYDITSNALPSDISDLFLKTVPTGEKYGTVTVIIGKDKVEVTTFRSDGAYEDSRRPGTINFVSNIEEDLSRRDFTVNAMAYNEKKGLVDPFGGQEDLKRHLIKTVGDPKKRFSEDALRILRALRFKAKLSFEIEENTMKSLSLLAPNVKNISGERIKAELDKILLSNSPSVIFEVVNLKILDFLLNVCKEYKMIDGYKIIDCFELPILWAQFFFFQSNINIESTINYLRFSKELRQDTLFYFYGLREPLPKSKIELKYRLLRLKSIENYKKLVLLRKKIFDEDVSDVVEFFNEIILNNEPYNLKMLKIDGNDLSKVGITKGKECGEILKNLLQLVVENPALNDRKILLKTAEDFIHHH